MIPYFDGHRTAVKHLVQFHQTHVSTFFFFFLVYPCLCYVLYCARFFLLLFLNMQISFDIVLYTIVHSLT